MPTNLHMFTNCVLLMLSKVKSSLKSLANLTICSFVTVLPLRTAFINSYKASAFSLFTPELLCFNPFAMTFTVSCRNFATSILAFSFRFNSSSYFNSSLNVLGNMFGNIFNATGKNISINGTNTNTANGTNRNTSAAVLVSCLLSLLVKVSPPMSLNPSRLAIFTSTHNSFAPDQ